MRKKIKLFYLAVAAFVIIAGGLITLHRLNADIAVLEDTAREARLEQLRVNTEKSDMQQEIAIKDSDAYIRDMARTMYGYLMPDEIKFVVVNPEALWDDYQAVQNVMIVEDSQEPAGEGRP